MMRQYVLGFSLAATSAAMAFDYDGTPRGHAWGFSETAGVVQQRIFEQWRPTSIVAETPGSLTTKFRVVYVKDASVSPATLRFLFDKTPAELNALRGEGWRLEDLTVLRTGAQPRLAALLRRYSAPPPETFAFWNYRADQVDALANAGNRVLDLDLDGVADGSQRFAGVMVRNTGAVQKGWGWMPDATAKEVGDWASKNGMRVIDFLEKPGGKYAAAFVKWDAAGGRSDHFVLTAGQIPDVLSARGMRLQTLDSRPGSQWFTGTMVNNVNPQSARIADVMSGATDGEVGAWVAPAGGSPIVNLRGDRKFYPCSAIKVLIHATGISRVAADKLETHKVGNELFKTLSTKMMWDSDNPSTYKLNHHWGTDSINAFGRNPLGMSAQTYIKDHYGNPPPNGEYNAWATLQDFANLYSNITKVGATKYVTLARWMLNETNSGLFDGEFAKAKAKHGLTSAQYNEWRSRVKLIFKAGNIGHANGGGDRDFVVCGRITLPHKGERMLALRSYTFGHFVNNAKTPYDNSKRWEIAATVIREQIEDSMKTYK